MLLFEDHRSESATVDHKSVVHAVAFSPDGSTLATGAKDGAVFVRDSAGRVSSLRERGPKCLATHAVGFLPDNTVVAGGAFGWLGWKPAGDGWQEFGPQSNRQVTSIAVLTDKMVAFGIGDRNNPTSGTFELWDISADRPYKPTHSESNGVWVVAACPASSPRRGTARRWRCRRTAARWRSPTTTPRRSTTSTGGASGCC
jgi:WD40 repeat protein